MVFSNTMLLFINFSPRLKKGRKPVTNQPIPLLPCPSAETTRHEDTDDGCGKSNHPAGGKDWGTILKCSGFVGEIFTNDYRLPEKDMSPGIEAASEGTLIVIIPVMVG